MTDIYRQTYEALTPPALPSGWNHDAGFATVGGSLLSGINSLSVTGTGLKSAIYATLDGKAGQVSVGSRVRVDSPGTSSAVRLVTRLSDATLANFGVSANAYVAEITLGTSNAADWKIYRHAAGSDGAALATGNTALRAALSAATAYDAALYANGTTASPGCVLTLEVQRVSDSLWLTTTGTWSADRQACLSFNDTTGTGVFSGGYPGVQANLASGATAYFDGFAVVDYIDPTTYIKVWTDDSGWTSGLGTIVAGQFNGGTEPGIQFAGDNVGRNFQSVTWNDRQYGNLPTGNLRFKFSVHSGTVATFFRVRQYRFNMNGTSALLELLNPAGTSLATIPYTYGNWTASREYRLIWSSTSTTIKFAVQDTVTGNYLKTGGTFGAGFSWAFNYTYPSVPDQGGRAFTVFMTNNGTVLTVGKVTIGPAGTPAVTPSPATVAAGGNQVFSPTYFTGAEATPSVPTGGGTFAGYTYTAPGTTGSATARFTGPYDATEVVDVPVTIASTAATSYTLTGPTSGTVGAASASFTVTPNGTTSGTVTPSDSGGGGTFTPASLTWTGDASAKTFTYTAGSAGTKSISISSSPALTYAGSPISHVATALLSTAYVASNGSDSTTNGGSSSAPFLTIAAARAAMVASGGTLNLRGGDTFSGALIFTAPVTIQSYGTGKAILTAAGTVLRFNDCDGVTANNLILANTTTSNPTVNFVNTDATRRTGGVAVTNCTITGGSFGVRLAAAAATAGGWNGIVVTGNDVSNATAIGITTGESGTAAGLKHFSNVLIQGNTVHGITGAGGFVGSGIVVGDADSTAATSYVRANHIYSCGASATSQAGPAGIFPLRSDGIVIEDNLIHDILSSSSGDDGDGIDADIDASNCIFQRNFIYNTGGAGMLFYSCGAGNVCRFNVFVNTGTTGTAGNSGINFYTNQPQVVHNNIVVNSATLACLTTRGSGPTFQKKVYNNVFISANGVPAIDTEAFDATFALEGNAYQSGTGVSWKVGGTTHTSLAAFRSATSRETGHGFVTTNPFIGYGTTAPAPTDPATMLATIGTYFDHTPGSALSLAGLNLSSLFGINPGTLDFKQSAIPTPPYSVGAIATAAAPATATTYTLTGPSSGAVGSASSNFTITPNAPYTGTITITPSGGGLSTPIVKTFSGSATPQTFTITPASAGTVTLTPSNNGSLTNPSALTYTATAVATSYTLTGPTTGVVNVASSNFTVTPDAAYTGTITVTPSGGGLSTPVVLTFSNSATPQTFTVTPTATGAVTLTPTNNGSLANPSAATYTATASGGGTPLTDQEIAAIAAEVVAQLNANTAGIPANVVAIAESPSAAVSLKADCLAIPADAYQAIAEIVAPMVAEIIGSIRLNVGTVLPSPAPTTTTFSASIVDADGDPATIGSNAFRGMNLILQGDVNSKRTITSHQVVGSTHKFAIDSANPLSVAPAAGTTFKIG